MAGLGRSGEAQGTRPGGCCRVQVGGDHPDNGGAVEMETGHTGNISGLADGMNKGVGQREIQGSLSFEELETFCLELRSRTQSAETGVVGPKISWVTSESSLC